MVSHLIKEYIGNVTEDTVKYCKNYYFLAKKIKYIDKNVKTLYKTRVLSDFEKKF